MHKVVLAAASFALFATAPAEARISGGTASPWPTPLRQPFPVHPSSTPSLGGQVDKLENKVERARENGLISRGEARQLRRDARLIDRLGHRYARDGLSQSERAELQNRIHRLDGAIYAAGGQRSTADRRNKR